MWCAPFPFDPDNGSVDFPNETVVYKNGYLPTSDDPSQPEMPAATSYVMVKLDGYCPDGSSIGDFCLGGDWFSLEIVNKTFGIVDAGSLNDYGKADGCFVCHSGAVTDGDWMWQLNSRRRFP